jgi:A/G-specific adenine glycosylase
VSRVALDAVWREPVQRERALAGLVADGLVEPLSDGWYALPGEAHHVDDDRELIT